MTSKKKKSLYLSAVSPKVLARLEKKSKETGIPKTLIVDKILQDFLGVTSGFNAKKWLK